tara:strand:- start:1303 stop:1611 length:309 start_codon:yes stop_codon:yes gene_type:complete
MSLTNIFLRNIKLVGNLSTPSLRYLSKTSVNYQPNRSNKILTTDDLLQFKQTVQLLKIQVKQMKNSIDMIGYKVNISESNLKYNYIHKLEQLWTSYKTNKKN